MAYRSEEELEEDMSRNPKLAKQRIAFAKQAGKKVVSRNNRGYGPTPEQNVGSGYMEAKKKAVTNRLSRSRLPAKKETSSTFNKEAITRRMKDRKLPPSSVPEEDETVTKRKKVGY